MYRDMRQINLDIGALFYSVILTLHIESIVKNVWR